MDTLTKLVEGEKLGLLTKVSADFAAGTAIGDAGDLLQKNDTSSPLLCINSRTAMNWTRRPDLKRCFGRGKAGIVREKACAL